MDFIERWFGVSPDGGSGSFEESVVLAAAIAIGVLVLRSRLRGLWTHRIGRLARLK